MPTPTSELRWCEDIGLFALDRPKSSCVHRTLYCDTHCYNNKFWRWPTVVEKDARNEAAWQAMDLRQLAEDLDRKRKPTDRLRLMTRGEALTTVEDINLVAAMADKLLGRLIWLPTRAWRRPEWQAALQSLRANHHNLIVLASLDPSNTKDEHKALTEDGWSTMYFGPTPPPWPTFGCPKTLRPVPPGHCAVCKAGCFAPRVLGRRVDVYLKEH